MAFDTDARKLTLNFPGGSVRGPAKLLEVVFGDTKLDAAMEGITKSVSVKAHSRVRVIGGPSKNIAANTYTRTRYPSGQAGGPAGGEPIKVLAAGDWWTLRLTGNHESFNQFLGGMVDPDDAGSGAIWWKSERGTSYGPFRKA
jgi:hypothetical protein